ncbi:MAG: hypothetical protein HYS41_03970 [Candidatus Omnitrophica bacterium]|nr:hypothetical protein [Candidatus Omnitrophota bacterium]
MKSSLDRKRVFRFSAWMVILALTLTQILPASVWADTSDFDKWPTLRTPAPTEAAGLEELKDSLSGTPPVGLEGLQRWGQLSEADQREVSAQLQRMGVDRPTLEKLASHAKRPVVPPDTLYELLAIALNKPIDAVRGEVSSLGSEAWRPLPTNAIGENVDISWEKKEVRRLLENTVVVLGAGGGGDRFKKSLPPAAREQLERLGRLEKPTVAVGPSGTSPVVNAFEELSALARQTGANGVQVVLVVGPDSEAAVSNDFEKNRERIDQSRLKITMVQQSSFPSFDEKTGEVVAAVDPKTKRARVVKNPNGTYGIFESAYRLAQEKGFSKGKSWLVLYGDDPILITGDFIARVLTQGKEFDVAPVATPKVSQSNPLGGTLVDLSLPGGGRIPLIVEEVERREDRAKGVKGLPLFNDIEEQAVRKEGDPFSFNTGDLLLSEKGAAAAAELPLVIRHADRSGVRKLERFLTHILTLVGSQPGMRAGVLQVEYKQYQAVKHFGALVEALKAQNARGRAVLKRLSTLQMDIDPSVFVEVRPGFQGLKGTGRLKLSGSMGAVFSPEGLTLVPIVQWDEATLSDGTSVRHPIFADPGEGNLVLQANLNGIITADERLLFTKDDAAAQPGSGLEEKKAGPEIFDPYRPAFLSRRPEIRFFGTDGVAGSYVESYDLRPGVINPMTAYRVGIGAGLLALSAGKPRVAVGMDPRSSSIHLALALLDGLKTVGAEPVLVGDKGIVTRPALLEAVADVGAGAGVYIGSDRPFPGNRINLFDQTGRPLNQEWQDRVERILRADNLRGVMAQEAAGLKAAPFYQEIRDLTTELPPEEPKAVEGYFNRLLPPAKRLFAAVGISPEKPAWVTVDLANGAGFFVAPVFMERLKPLVDVRFWANTAPGDSINSSSGAGFLDSQRAQPAVSLPLPKAVAETDLRDGILVSGDGTFSQTLASALTSSRSKRIIADGDMLAALYAAFIQKHLAALNLEKTLRVGVVRTPYQDDRAQQYLRELGVKQGKYVRPGERHLAERLEEGLRDAQEGFDIGIGFEPAGNGLVRFGDKARQVIQAASGGKAQEALLALDRLHRGARGGDTLRHLLSILAMVRDLARPGEQAGDLLERMYQPVFRAQRATSPVPNPRAIQTQGIGFVNILHPAAAAQAAAGPVLPVDLGASIQKLLGSYPYPNVARVVVRPSEVAEGPVRVVVLGTDSFAVGKAADEALGLVEGLKDLWDLPETAEMAGLEEKGGAAKPAASPAKRFTVLLDGLIEIYRAAGGEALKSLEGIRDGFREAESVDSVVSALGVVKRHPVPSETAGEIISEIYRLAGEPWSREGKPQFRAGAMDELEPLSIGEMKGRWWYLHTQFEKIPNDLNRWGKLHPEKRVLFVGYLEPGAPLVPENLRWAPLGEFGAPLPQALLKVSQMTLTLSEPDSGLAVSGVELTLARSDRGWIAVVAPSVENTAHLKELLLETSPATGLEEGFEFQVVDHLPFAVAKKSVRLTSPGSQQLPNGSWLTVEGDGVIYIAPGARIGPWSVLAAGSDEFLMLQQDVTVRERTTIEGSVRIGEGSQVRGLVQGHPKAVTLLGPGTRILSPSAEIGPGVITVPVTDENGKRHVVSIDSAHIGEPAGKGPVVIWGGTDLRKGVRVRANSVLGPFAHIGPGSETKGTFWMGASAENDSALAHRAYGGNLVAIPVYLNGTPLDLVWHEQLLEHLSALRFGRVLERKTDRLTKAGPAVKPKELLVLDFDGKRWNVAARAINFGDGSGSSNFKSVSGGRKAIGILSAGVALGVGAKVQTPAFVGPDSLIDNHAQAAGMQAAVPSTYVRPIGTTPDKAFRPGAVADFQGKGKGAGETALFLANLKTLQTLARVSVVGLQHTRDPWVQEALRAEIRALEGHFREIDAYTPKELELLGNSPDAGQGEEFTRQAEVLRAGWPEILAVTGLEEGQAAEAPPAGEKGKTITLGGVEVPLGERPELGGIQVGEVPGGGTVTVVPPLGKKLIVLGPEALPVLDALSVVRPSDGKRIPLVAVVRGDGQAKAVRDQAAQLELPLLEVVNLEETESTLEQAIQDIFTRYILRDDEVWDLRVYYTMDQLLEAARFLGVPEPEAFVQAAEGLLQEAAGRYL